MCCDFSFHGPFDDGQLPVRPKRAEIIPFTEWHSVRRQQMGSFVRDASHRQSMATPTCTSSVLWLGQSVLPIKLIGISAFTWKINATKIKTMVKLQLATAITSTLFRWTIKMDSSTEMAIKNELCQICFVSAQARTLSSKLVRMWLCRRVKNRVAALKQSKKKSKKTKRHRNFPFERWKNHDCYIFAHLVAFVRADRSRYRKPKHQFCLFRMTYKSNVP